MSDFSAEMTKGEATNLALYAQSECPGLVATIVPWTDKYWTVQVFYNDEVLWVHSPHMWERTKKHYCEDRARYYAGHKSQT
jgi:hypothetical protein